MVIYYVYFIQEGYYGYNKNALYIITRGLSES